VRGCPQPQYGNYIVTRTLTLAALAVLLAAPAHAEAIRISTANKTPEQVKIEIREAAYKVCRAEPDYTVFAFQLRTTCKRRAAREALDQYNSAEMIESASQ
jgi:hypothetical protein